MHDVHLLRREVSRQSDALSQCGEPMQPWQRQGQNRNSLLAIPLQQGTLILQADDRHVKARMVEAFRRTQRVQLGAAYAHVIDAERHPDKFRGVHSTRWTRALRKLFRRERSAAHQPRRLNNTEGSVLTMILRSRLRLR